MSQLQMQRAPERVASPAGTGRTNRMAIWALVLAIVNLGGIGSLIGIVLGVKARGRIGSSGEGGGGVALAAVVVGVLTLIGAVVYWVYVAHHMGGGSGGGGTNPGGGY